MSSDEDPTLAARVERLESALDALTTELESVRDELRQARGGSPDDGWTGQPPPWSPQQQGWGHPAQPNHPQGVQATHPPPGWVGPAVGQPAAEPGPGPGRPSPTQRASMSTEALVSRIGIGLLIIGLGFLFKYGVDRGLLGPAARVALGGTLGLVLLGAGTMLGTSRAALSQVMMGGAMAALFTTAYAAHDLYGLVPLAPTVVGLSLLHSLYFVLAVRLSRASLAVIGALGAYATPLALLAPEGTDLGLQVYVLTVGIGVGAVIAARGWPALVWLAGLTAWLATAACTLGVGDASALSVLTAVTTWVVYGWLPALRPMLAAAPASRERAATPMLPLSALLGITLLGEHLRWSGTELGAAALATSLGMAAVAWALHARRWDDEHGLAVGAAATLTAIGGLVSGIGLMVVDPVLQQAAWVAAAAALCVAAGHTRHEALSSMAPLAWIPPVALFFLEHCLAVDDALPSSMLAVDGILGLSMLGAAALAPGLKRRGILALGGYLVLLAWAFFPVGALANGAAIGSVVWASAGVSALIAGLRLRIDMARTLGMATLIGLVAKLLLIDLSALAAVWRILLFMGFGIAFLGLGYLVPRLVRDAPEDD